MLEHSSGGKPREKNLYRDVVIAGTEKNVKIYRETREFAIVSWI